MALQIPNYFAPQVRRPQQPATGGVAIGPGGTRYAAPLPMAPAPGPAVPPSVPNIPTFQPAMPDPRIGQLVQTLTQQATQPFDASARVQSSLEQLGRPIDVALPATSVNVGNIGADPEAAAYRIARERGLERQREAAAARMAASGGGVTGSGAFDVELGELGRGAALDIAGFEAGLAGRRRGELLEAEQRRFQAEMARELARREGLGQAASMELTARGGQAGEQLALLQTLLGEQARQAGLAGTRFEQELAASAEARSAEELALRRRQAEEDRERQELERELLRQRVTTGRRGLGMPTGGLQIPRY